MVRWVAVVSTRLARRSARRAAVSASATRILRNRSANSLWSGVGPASAGVAHAMHRLTWRAFHCFFEKFSSPFGFWHALHLLKFVGVVGVAGVDGGFK